MVQETDIPSFGDRLDLVDPVSDRQFRTPYDGRAPSMSRLTGVFFVPPEEEEFSAQQQFRDECDLNLIVQRSDVDYFERHKERAASGQYLDLAGLPDFTEAMNIVTEANAAFMDLPAPVRKEFDNDPAKFLEFVDTASRADMEKFGLVPPLPPQASPSNANPEPSDDGQGEA